MWICVRLRCGAAAGTRVQGGINSSKRQQSKKVTQEPAAVDGRRYVQSFCLPRLARCWVDPASDWQYCVFRKTFCLLDA